MSLISKAVRRSRRWPLGIATAVLAGVLVHACTEVTDPSLIPVPIQSLAMAPVADTVVIGDSTQLHAVGINLNGTPFVQPGASWESSDPMVATVSDEGHVKGVAPGAATITATMLGFSATANIFVTPRPVITGSDDSVAFAGVANGPAPAAQTIDVTNSGGGVLTGIVVDSIVYTGLAGWLNASLANGSEPDVLTLQPNTTALPIGPYLATVWVSAPSTENGPLQIKASFDVTFGAAASIALESGDGQTAAVNTAVAIDPAVIVRDAFNNPVTGASVTFAVTGGGGSVNPVAAVLTGVDGIARVTSWTLGTIIGTNTLTATSGGLTGSPITFTATGTPGPAAQIAKFSGDAQSATVGTQVATAPTVRVTDQFGNFVAGTSVTFAVVSGGGGATGTATTSDVNGLASVGTWTLGTTSGANTMTATSAGLTGSPLTFTATGTVGAATQIVKSGGDAQTAAAGTAVAIDPSVTVRDQFGNGVPGASVTFAVASGGGSVVPATPIITNALGVAQVTSWTLGNVAGPNSLTATSGALIGSPLTFTATGTAGAATTIAKISGDAQTDSIGKKLNTAALRVRVTDALGNGVGGVVVTWAGTGGATLTNATSTTDASGFAPDTLILGNVAGAQGATATAAGLAGSPITFTATATPGNATTIALNAGNAQTDTIGAPLAIQYAVRVSDRANNSKPGVTVTWGATGGSITPSSITAASGIAVANRVLGNTTGAQAASATVAGLAGSPVAFTATATNGNATTIVLNAGNAQTDTIGAPLAIAYAVRITDRAANSVVGATVNWSAPAGTITPSSLTNAGGIATASRTLGSTAGPQPSTATAVALPGSPIGFTATATAGNPTTLAKNGGDGQGATVNTAVPIAPSAIVTDRAGNAVSGRNVTFATTPTNGTVVPVTPIATNASGIAQVTSWTMGAVAKPDTMTATSAGLAGSPLIFTANAISGSASAIALSAGNAQTDTIGATLAVQYAVLITDNIGNPVSGIPVSWAVTGGGGSITPTSNSNASGIAVATRVLGNTAGAQTASASVGGLTGSPVLFTATALVGNAQNIAVNAGNNQSATVNTNVATPPSAIVTDRAGNPVSGVNVTFAVTGGGGSVNPVTAIATNASGIAQVTSWTMGTVAGTSNNTLSATSAGLMGSPVAFAASATAGAATQIAVNAGNNQSATVNTNVATPPSVIVRDQFNNPVSGVNVTFAVTGGGGSVNPVTAVATSASGIAQVTSWTLGTSAGTNNNTLSATAAVAGSPVIFTASATAGAATQFLLNGGNNQSATVNTNVGIAPSVIARDQFNNPVSGVSVTFAVTGGGGSVNPATAFLTNASGIAQVTSWTLGTVAGTNNNTLSATAAVAGSPVGFTASAMAGAATQMSINGGNNQSATVNTNVATAPSVIVRDQFLNPVSGVSVTFGVTGGGGSVNPGTAVLSNASGIAQVTSWTMGTVSGTNNNTLSATSAGLGGSPANFLASANPGAVNAAQSSVVAGTASITACSASCTVGTLASLITVTVRDQFANVIPGASVIISASGSNNVLSPSASGSSSASGVYQAILNSTLAQAKTISATGNGVGITQTAAVTVNAAAVSLSNSLLSAATSPITACSGTCFNGSTASLVTVTIRDAFSNPVSGQTVTPSCSVGTSCVFSPANGVTSGTGVFQTSFRSTLAQGKTIRATVTGPGLINATDGVTVVAAAPSSVTVTNEGFSARVGTGLVTRPTFTVRDAFSNLVPNFAVSYGSSFSGAFTGPSTTNASGQATLTSWTMAGTNTDASNGTMANNVTLTAGSASNTATSFGIYTYSGDVGPLIGTSGSLGCEGCHYASWTRANIVNVFQGDPVGYQSCTIANTVDFLVLAGDANNSLLYLKTSSAPPCGSAMPNASGVSAAQRKIIRAWINNGALNN